MGDMIMCDKSFKIHNINVQPFFFFGGDKGMISHFTNLS